MPYRETKAWIKKSKAAGLSNSQIREHLRISGWSEQQIDKVLPSSQSGPLASIPRVSTGDVFSSPALKKIWVGVLIFAIIIIIGGAIYFLGDQFGLPWQGNTNTYINTNTYVSPTSIDKQLVAQTTMKQFENYDQLREFLDNNTTTDYYGYGGLGLRTSDIILEEGLAAPSLDSEFGQTFGLGTDELKAAPPTDFSTTNIQVAGVDEADIVKSDGEHLYIVSKKNVFIVDAYPASEATILSTIVLKSTPQDVYINGDSLVIYGREDDIRDRPFYDLIRPYSSYTFLKVFNIKDRSNPKQVRDINFEGSYTNSRMIGDYVYFITAQPTYSVLEDYPIPMVVEDNELLLIDPAVKGCNCPDMFYIDIPYGSYTYTTVTAINVVDNDKGITSDVFLLSGTENMYVSTKNIYFAYTKYISEEQLALEVLKEIVYPRLSDKKKVQVDDIDKAPAHVLSQTEKSLKVGQIVTQYVTSLAQKDQEALQEELEIRMKKKYDDISKELEKTVIHKIAISQDNLKYQGSGEVAGHVLNQFSMDEQDGYFRIATTKNRTWSQFEDTSRQSYNNVYILDENLNVVGKVENLAKGEQIYSARFMQGRVYLVTFRQTDPLFVIDLSDPKNPKVLGELKVPGFSSYLHPFNETTLIGFGKQATEEGVVKGLKLSLFDVSDVNNLREIDTYEMGDAGSTSIALDDHKAFLFSGSKDLLVVPVTLRERITEESYGSISTHGAMVFTVTKDGFTFRQRIDHSDGTADDSTSRYFYGYNYYDTTVKRSLYIEDVLYTLSNKYIKMHGLADLEEVKSLTLTPGESGEDYTIISQ